MPSGGIAFSTASLWSAPIAPAHGHAVVVGGAVGSALNAHDARVLGFIHIVLEPAPALARVNVVAAVAVVFLA
jgi:hypothetical protein